MRAVDVANRLLEAHGGQIPLTNRRIVLLVFFAQVEALRADGLALYGDRIEAGDDGPTVPAVHDAFAQYGSNQIGKPTAPAPRDARLARIAALVAGRYGHLTVFDLVRLAHRQGGAWQHAYRPGGHAEITPTLLMACTDVREEPDLGRTLAARLQCVNDTWPNTLTLLERS